VSWRPSNLTPDLTTTALAIPCKEDGNTLPRNEWDIPPPRHEKLADDWAPFGSKLEFDIAEFVYCKAKMSRGNTNTLMKLFASLCGGAPVFTDYDDLCETIDSTDLGDVPWECSKLQYNEALPPNDIPEWMTAEYDLYYRDPNEVIKNILSNATYDGAFDYVPYQEYDSDGVRRYENLMSGDWAFKQAVRQYQPLSQPYSCSNHDRRYSRRTKKTTARCLYLLY